MKDPLIDRSPDYWRDKRVVVTGGAGFLGSFVVERLNRLGCEHVVVPRKREFNLLHESEIVKLLGVASRTSLFTLRLWSAASAPTARIQGGSCTKTS